MKGRTVISNKQNVKNQAFKVGFAFLKIKLIVNLKLKIKLPETKIQQSILYKICRIFSASKRPLNFENPSTGSEEISSGRRDLFQLRFQIKTQKSKGSIAI